MTDSVHPTQGEASSQLTSGVIKWSADTDWIVPSGTDYLASFDGLAGTPLNGFEVASTDGLDATIDSGEAFAGGRWMARDQQTTITLDASTTNTVYIGWLSGESNSVVMGVGGAVPSSDGGREMAAWDIETDSTSVTGTNRVHETEPVSNYAQTAQDADALGGNPASSYPRVDQPENISGGWTIQNASSVNSRGFLMDRSGHGLNFGVGGENNERPFIAPYQNGGSNFSNEITYDGGNWRVETPLEISSEGNWAVFSGTQYEIQKNGTDGEGIINFKTD